MRIVILHLAFLGSCLTMSSCGTHAAVTPRPTDTAGTRVFSLQQNEQCAILKAVAVELCKLTRSGRTELSALREAANEYPLRAIADDRETLNAQFREQADLVEQLVQVSRATSNHDCPAETGVIKFQSADEIKRKHTNPEHWWADFRKAQPESCGIGGFSRVAVSTDHSRALLYAEISYGELAADGSYWLLLRKKDRWIVSKRWGLWMT